MYNSFSQATLAIISDIIPFLVRPADGIEAARPRLTIPLSGGFVLILDVGGP